MPSLDLKEMGTKGTFFPFSSVAGRMDKSGLMRAVKEVYSRAQQYPAYSTRLGFVPQLLRHKYKLRKGSRFSRDQSLTTKNFSTFKIKSQVARGNPSQSRAALSPQCGVTPRLIPLAAIKDNKYAIAGIKADSSDSISGTWFSCGCKRALPAAARGCWAPVWEWKRKSAEASYFTCHVLLSSATAPWPPPELSGNRQKYLDLCKQEIFGNAQYMVAISTAAELPCSSILGAKIHLMVLHLPAGLSQAC